MPDSLAGRRVLEHFGLLAITPADKKQDKFRSPFEAPRMKKIAAVERPRKSK